MFAPSSYPFAAPSAFPSYAASPFPGAFGASGFPPFGFPSAPFGFPGVAPLSVPPAAASAAADDEAPMYKSMDQVEGPRNILGYWKIRGLAAPIRMFLAYQGIAYENKFYGSREEWAEHRDNVLKANNPLINLPYLETVDEDSGLLLAQSQAIMNHLGSRFNLRGCTEIDAAKSDMLMEQCHDLRSAFVNLCYRSQNFEADREAYFAAGGSFETQLQKFEDWMACQKATFLVEDDHPIAADFVLWELLDVHQMMNGAALENFPLLQGLYQAFRGLKELEGYFNSELYALPVNSPAFAKWYGPEPQ